MDMWPSPFLLRPMRDCASHRGTWLPKSANAQHTREGKSLSLLSPVRQAMQFSIIESDPQGPEALRLLREAAIEARDLYPELHDPQAPWPTNHPTPARGAYFVAYARTRAVGMGSHRPLDQDSTEVRRMYVLREARRAGLAQAILASIESHARTQGFKRLLLETGYRQLPAMKLYESFGFKRIASFGDYKNDPTSVCYEKHIVSTPSGA